MEYVRSQVVFYLIMLFVVMAALDFTGLSTTVGPISDFVATLDRWLASLGLDLGRLRTAEAEGDAVEAGDAADAAEAAKAHQARQRRPLQPLSADRLHPLSGCSPPR